MRLVLQRVTEASVSIGGEVVAEIGPGLVALVGIGEGDDLKTVRRAAEKTAEMRIFRDEDGRFDRSVLDIEGSVLIVSQFTLLADTRRGSRPSFSWAAAPAVAEPLVGLYIDALKELGVKVAAGQFGADMQVALVNDGPVTIVHDAT